MPQVSATRPDDNSPIENRQANAEQQIVELSRRIDFQVTEYTVEYLADKVHKNEYVVPDYQRNFTWEHHRKSKFIESLIMGLPIPFVFFWEMPDGRLEIVDGSQRLRTIDEFIFGDLKLGRLDRLDALSGFKFTELPVARQRKIKNRSVRGIVLNEHADIESRVDMFERINTGSKAANPAEVRRGALPGPFTEMIIKLATEETLKTLAPMSPKREDEREYEELVTRFFAYSDGLDNYKDDPANFMFSYVRRMNADASSNPGLLQEYESRFLKMLRFVKKTFPSGFRKTPGSNSTPRSRYEAIAIGADGALNKTPELLDSTIDVSSWIDSPEFQNIVGSDGANSIARLKGRIDFVQSKLSGDPNA